MKNSNDLLYNIKDLRIVMINRDYLEQKQDEYINYFNENVKFIVEKYILEDNDKYGLPYYAEYYTECITEEDLSVRVSHKPLSDNPEIFSMVEEIPLKYFTDEEKETGTITIPRIFKILQDINVPQKNNHKVRKLGAKK